MTAARPQIRTEQHGQAPALTTAVLSLSRSPSPPTAGNSARTRCTIRPGSIRAGPGAAGKGGQRFEVSMNGRDGSGGNRH